MKTLPTLWICSSSTTNYFKHFRRFRKSIVRTIFTFILRVNVRSVYIVFRTRSIWTSVFLKPPFYLRTSIRSTRLPTWGRRLVPTRRVSYNRRSPRSTVYTPDTRTFRTLQTGPEVTYLKTNYLLVRVVGLKSVRQKISEQLKLCTGYPDYYGRSVPITLRSQFINYVSWIVFLTGHDSWVIDPTTPPTKFKEKVLGYGNYGGSGRLGKVEVRHTDTVVPDLRVGPSIATNVVQLSLHIGMWVRIEGTVVTTTKEWCLGYSGFGHVGDWDLSVTPFVKGSLREMEVPSVEPVGLLCREERFLKHSLQIRVLVWEVTTVSSDRTGRWVWGRPTTDYLCRGLKESKTTSNESGRTQSPVWFSSIIPSFESSWPHRRRKSRSLRSNRGLREMGSLDFSVVTKREKRK